MELTDGVIALPDEVVLELERLSYEVNGLKVLHTHALNAGLERSKIREIRREFLDKNTEYRLAAQEVATAYGAAGEWHIDFAEGVLRLGA